MMCRYWLFLSTFRLLYAFSNTETQIILDLFNYFKCDYVDILEEDLLITSNSSFPSKNMIMTAALNSEEIVQRLKKIDGMSLVAASGDSKTWQNFLKVSNEAKMNAAKWILFSSNLQDVNNLYIPFDCEFVMVDISKNLPILTEIYQIGPNEEMQKHHFGYWDPLNGLNVREKLFYRRRSHFKGFTFTAVIQNIPPYTYVTQLPNGTLQLNGYFNEIWKELETRLKFKTNFRLIGLNEDYTSILSKNEATFAILPVVQDPQNAKLVGLTEPVYNAKIYLFGNRPGSELEWDSYLKPFSTETWLATLLWMICSSAAMSILYLVAWKQQTSEPEAGYYVFPVPVCFETVFRAVCGQGSDVTPRSLSCRILFLSIYSTALVVTSAFSAALFSLLTIPVSKAPFNSFQDVINQKNYKIALIHGSDIYKGIKDLSERFTDSEQSKLFQMIEMQDQLPSTVQQALERVCNRKDYIFMWDLPNVLEVMKDMNRTCQEKIMPGGPMLFKEDLGFGTVLDNPYKGLINLHLRRLKNEGILRRLLLNTWPPHIPNVQTSWVRVTLGDISPILYMFALGATLALLILLAENLHWRSRLKTHNASRAIAEHIHTASHFLQNYDDSWSTRYTDWDQNENLHRRHKLHHH